MANTKKYVSLAKLSLYDEKIKKVISDGDAATLVSANSYADGKAAESAAEVQGKLDEEVIRAKAREDEIAGLVATAQGEVDALEEVVATKAAQADLEALAGKVGTVPEGSTVMGIIANIQENAYDDTELRGLITGLDTNKADKTQVATDIAAAVKVEEEARIEAVAGVQGAVDTLSETHATDKAALEAAIALKADQTALDAVSGVANAAATKTELQEEVERAQGEEARIEGLITAEAERAAGVEEGLQNQINTIMSNPDAEGAINSINEFTRYVTEHGTIAEGFRTDINKNTEDIASHVALDHDFAAADTALKNELNGEIAKKADKTYVDEELAKKADKTYVDEELAKKANAQDVTDAVAALEEADEALAGRLTDVEAVLGTGEGSVAEQISTAKEEAITAAAEDATNKANQALADAKEDAASKDAVVLAEAQKGIDAVQGVVDTHTGNADIHVTADDKAKWNAALQAADVTTGSANGTIAVKGTDVAVKGLGSAAYVATTAFDASGSAAQALTDANAYTDAAVANFVEVSEQEILDLFA